MVNERASKATFFVASALLFAAGAAVTIAMCRSMSAMGGDMLMPGGWTMSMIWMRMPDQTWLGAVATFMGMWVAMMAAMMLPPLVQMLIRYRNAIVASGTSGLDLLTGIAGAGYFCVWTVIGLATYGLGIGVATLEMQHDALSRCAPMATGLLVLLAGAFQLTAWKARQLACCRACEPLPFPSEVDGLSRGKARYRAAASAWRYGLRFGVRCSRCCWTLMTLLVVVGIMDLRLMAVLTAAMTAERLTPAGDRIARAVGVVVGAAGLFLIAWAAGLV